MPKTYTLFCCHLCCFTTYIDIPSSAFTDPDDAHHSEDEGSDDSDDGLPPLERNLNHITLEESDDESE